jgi:16S rRNA A1518/A1519 N6-dimethyltransferase RsmA/KsgA/DIM1 with predicted DNA glycosylase/AP lyase activity
MEAREPTYVFDQRWQEERGRLEGIEALWDAGSAAALEQAGVGPGWSCVEVGAGGGSMVEWLSDRTGPEVDTRFLDAIERDNVTVATNDILTEDLPGVPFDLVYSRLVSSTSA